jgi:hypothetical protein
VIETLEEDKVIWDASSIIKHRGLKEDDSTIKNKKSTTLPVGGDKLLSAALKSQNLGVSSGIGLLTPKATPELLNL